MRLQNGTKWYEGFPPAEAVAAHEVGHRGKRYGFLPAEIMVSDGENKQRQLPGDNDLYGSWLIDHYKADFRYQSVSRLKVAEGNVYMQLGFTQWILVDCLRWKDDVRCYPVSEDGLPEGYKVG